MTEQEVEREADNLLFSWLYTGREGFLDVYRQVMGRDGDDVLAVTLEIAKRVAEGRQLRPGQTLHALTVTYLDPVTGERREGDIDALPGPVLCFGRMVTALANGDDQGMVAALWRGFVGGCGCGSCAGAVLIVGVKIMADDWRGGCTCSPGVNQ